MKLSITLLTFVALLNLTACGSTSKQIKHHTFTTDISGMVKDESATPTLLYNRPDAPTLASYEHFIVDPVRINYNEPNARKIKQADLARMQHYFREQVSNELRKAGYPISNIPGPNTLRITFTLSGIKAPSALLNTVGVIAPVALSVGEVTVEAAFSNSQSEQIDAVVIDRSQGSRVFNAKPWSTWADIESTFDHWAEGIADAVKKSHRQ